MALIVCGHRLAKWTSTTTAPLEFESRRSVVLAALCVHFVVVLNNQPGECLCRRLIKPTCLPLTAGWLAGYLAGLDSRRQLNSPRLSLGGARARQVSLIVFRYRSEERIVITRRCGRRRRRRQLNLVPLLETFCFCSCSIFCALAERPDHFYSYSLLSSSTWLSSKKPKRNNHGDDDGGDDDKTAT